jgi:hypothetical protein
MAESAQFLCLSSGEKVLVDADVAVWAKRFRWELDHCGYVQRWVRCRDGRKFPVKIHREIMRPEQGGIVHHRNLNPLDNRRENLEVLSREEHREKHRRIVRKHERSPEFDPLSRTQAIRSIRDPLLWDLACYAAENVAKESSG